MVWNKELTNLYQRGDYNKCVRVCFESLYRNLNDALCWCVLGMSLKNLDRTEEAVVALKTALDIDEELIEPLIPLAEALLIEGKMDEARHWIEKCLLHDENNISARCVFAECLRREGKPFEAIETLRESIHMAGLNSRMNFQLCQSFFISVEAVDEKNRQEKGKSRFSASHIGELGVNHTNGLNFEMKGYLEQLVASAPNLSDAHVLLGACYSSEGQFELAERHYKKAYQLDALQDRAYTARLCDSYFDILNKISVDDMVSKLPDVHCDDDNFRVDQPIVFISCDYNYFFTFAIALIHSIRCNSADINLHIHLMCLSSGTEEMSRIKDYIDKIENIQVNFSYEVIPTSLSKQVRRGYFASARLFRLFQFILRYNSPIMNLDVDGLVLKHLDLLFHYVEGHDIGVRVRPGRFDPWNQVDAAGFVINPTELGIGYIELVAKYVGLFALEERSSWMLDQMSLFSTMEFFRRHRHIDVKLLEDKMFGDEITIFKKSLDYQFALKKWFLGDRRGARKGLRPYLMSKKFLITYFLTAICSYNNFESIKTRIKKLQYNAIDK